MSIRQLTRHCVLSSLAAIDSIRGRDKEISQKQIVQVVNFHHLYDYEADKFRAFLNWFVAHYHPITYSEAVRKVQSTSLDKAYGAITFDDGLKSITRAGKILAEFDVSAAFFVCPGIIGETEPAKLRQFCVDARMDYESDEFVNWDDVELLLNQNHEIGSHTTRHSMLSNASSQQLVDELSGSKSLLERRIGAINHFAWPFGTFETFGKTAAQAFLQTSYKSCGSGVRGAHGPIGKTELPIPCLRRDNAEARWPLEHIKYFLIRNANNPVGLDSWWPQEWQVPAQIEPQ